jgi:hypothetical protein
MLNSCDGPHSHKQFGAADTVFSIDKSYGNDPEGSMEDVPMEGEKGLIPTTPSLPAAPSDLHRTRFCLCSGFVGLWRT